MIRIDITAAAFDAISATLPLGSVGYEAELDAPVAGPPEWCWSAA